MLNFTLNGIVILFIWILVVAVWTVEPVCVCAHTRVHTHACECVYVFFSSNVLTSCRPVLCLQCLIDKSAQSICEDLLKEEINAGRGG